MKLFEENIDEFISKPVAERIRLKELVLPIQHEVCGFTNMRFA